MVSGFRFLFNAAVFIVIAVSLTVIDWKVRVRSSLICTKAFIYFIFKQTVNAPLE